MIQLTAQGDCLFRDDIQSFTSILSRLQLEVGDRVTPARDEVFHELGQAIRTMSRKCRLFQQRCEDSSHLVAMQRFFQQCIAPWFDRSWFMARAKEKPRGYPGDFELLTGIYDGQVRSAGLGGYLDLYFLHSDLGQAVVARMRAAREFLNHEAKQRGGDLVILNVASGPCREYFTGLELHQNGRRIVIHCIDSDSAALDFVANRWAEHGSAARPKLEFNQYNALRMRSARANIARFGKADIIYSIGLLDYIPDRHLIPIVAGLRETLKPGGVAYLAFKDETGYDACEYQWFVDWHFYQRNERQCLDLLHHAGFHDEELEVHRDATGIIMNFTAQASMGSTLRVDAGQRRLNGKRGVPVAVESEM